MLGFVSLSAEEEIALPNSAATRLTKFCKYNAYISQWCSELDCLCNILREYSCGGKKTLCINFINGKSNDDWEDVSIQIYQPCKVPWVSFSLLIFGS